MTTRSNFDSAEPAAINGHQRRRHETRKQLLVAGRRLFVERGVSNTSIAAITAAAGVAKGSFYNHFESRDSLFDEVLESTLRKVIDKYLNYVPVVDDPLALAVAGTRVAFTALLSDPEACRLLLQSGPPVPGGAVDRVLRMALGDDLKLAAASGMQHGVDPGLVYVAYFGVVTETIGYLLTQGDALDPERGAEQVTRLCFSVLGFPNVTLEYFD